MSETSKIFKGIQQASAKLDELRNTFSLEILDRDTIESQLLDTTTIHSEIGELYVRLDKLLSKLHYKDPVTGAERYGAATKTKILSMEKDWIEVNNNCIQLKEDITKHLEICPVKVEKPMESEIIVEIDEEAEKIALEEKRKQDEQNKKRLEELREKAQIIREKKMKLMEELVAIESKITPLLKNSVKYLNSIRKKDDLSGTQLIRLVEILKEKEPPKNVKSVLSTSVDLLDRILARPDDKLLRKIRITHPLLKDKLTGLRGGMEILLLLGFQINLINPKSQPKSTPSNIPVESNTQMASAITSALNSAGIATDQSEIEEFLEKADKLLKEADMREDLMNYRGMDNNSRKNFILHFDRSQRKKLQQIILNYEDENKYKLFQDNNNLEKKENITDISDNKNEENNANIDNIDIGVLQSLQFNENSGAFELLPLLAPNTHWELNLEMQEPSMDISGSDLSGGGAWIQWFDSLTLYRKILNGDT